MAEAASDAAPKTLRVDGRAHRFSVDIPVTLLDASPGRIGLTGLESDAITAIVQDRPITIIERPATGDAPHPMQQATIPMEA